MPKRKKRSTHSSFLFNCLSEIVKCQLYQSTKFSLPKLVLGTSRMLSNFYNKPKASCRLYLLDFIEGAVDFPRAGRTVRRRHSQRARDRASHSVRGAGAPASVRAPAGAVQGFSPLRWPPSTSSCLPCNLFPRRTQRAISTNFDLTNVFFPSACRGRTQRYWGFSSRPPQ